MEIIKNVNNLIQNKVNFQLIKAHNKRKLCACLQRKYSDIPMFKSIKLASKLNGT